MPDLVMHEGVRRGPRGPGAKFLGELAFRQVRPFHAPDYIAGGWRTADAGPAMH